MNLLGTEKVVEETDDSISIVKHQSSPSTPRRDMDAYFGELGLTPIGSNPESLNNSYIENFSVISQKLKKAMSRSASQGIVSDDPIRVHLNFDNDATPQEIQQAIEQNVVDAENDVTPVRVNINDVDDDATPEKIQNAVDTDDVTPIRVHVSSDAESTPPRVRQAIEKANEDDKTPEHLQINFHADDDKTPDRVIAPVSDSPENEDLEEGFRESNDATPKRIKAKLTRFVSTRLIDAAPINGFYVRYQELLRNVDIYTEKSLSVPSTILSSDVESLRGMLIEIDDLSQDFDNFDKEITDEVNISNVSNGKYNNLLFGFSLRAAELKNTIEELIGVYQTRVNLIQSGKLKEIEEKFNKRYKLFLATLEKENLEESVSKIESAIIELQNNIINAGEKINDDEKELEIEIAKNWIEKLTEKNKQLNVEIAKIKTETEKAFKDKYQSLIESSEKSIEKLEIRLSEINLAIQELQTSSQANQSPESTQKKAELEESNRWLKLLTEKAHQLTQSRDVLEKTIKDELNKQCKSLLIDSSEISDLEAHVKLIKQKIEELGKNVVVTEEKDSSSANTEKHLRSEYSKKFIAELNTKSNALEKEIKELYDISEDYVADRYQGLLIPSLDLETRLEKIKFAIGEIKSVVDPFAKNHSLKTKEKALRSSYEEWLKTLQQESKDLSSKLLECKQSDEKLDAVHLLFDNAEQVNLERALEDKEIKRREKIKKELEKRRDLVASIEPGAAHLFKQKPAVADAEIKHNSSSYVPINKGLPEKLQVVSKVNILPVITTDAPVNLKPASLNSKPASSSAMAQKQTNNSVSIPSQANTNKAPKVNVDIESLKTGLDKYLQKRNQDYSWRDKVGAIFCCAGTTNKDKRKDSVKTIKDALSDYQKAGGTEDTKKALLNEIVDVAEKSGSWRFDYENSLKYQLADIVEKLQLLEVVKDKAGRVRSITEALLRDKQSHGQSSRVMALTRIR